MKRILVKTRIPNVSNIFAYKGMFVKDIKTVHMDRNVCGDNVFKLARLVKSSKQRRSMPLSFPGETNLSQHLLTVHLLSNVSVACAGQSPAIQKKTVMKEIHV